VATGNHRAYGGHLTFKGNLKDTRYGWLRLTPAYSLNLVDELLDGIDEGDRVLDPFCGTGTTALVSAQKGIDTVTTDINPFLIWLTKTKTATYSKANLAALDRRATEVAAAIDATNAEAEWLPPLHQIEKWWDEVTLHGLGRAMAAIKRTDTGGPTDDLLRVTFCRTAIERATVSFGHQSMSFKKRVESEHLLSAHTLKSLLHENWGASVVSFRDAAAATQVTVQPEALLLDARALCDGIEKETIARVITSPPYPNRMSYIRELRPYLYWLSYLTDAKQAAELDWTAIGGTWGMATSRVGKWEPTDDRAIAYKPFMSIIRKVAKSGTSGPLLSRYIHKYFFDMVEHIDQLCQVMEPGGIAHYIVGNSKFYGTLLPVQDIYAAMFQAQGFENVKVRAFRKRSSKRELFEFLVEARRQ
jgi:DNA modification methylase